MKRGEIPAFLRQHIFYTAVIFSGGVGKIGLRTNRKSIASECEPTVDSSIKRGDIYYADLSPVVGSEQGGIRPVLIVQNNVGNRYSPTVIAAAITSQVNKAKMPTHITVGAPKYGLTRDSIILTEQIRTLDKRRLREKMGSLDETAMRHVDEALAVSFGLGSARG